MSYKQVVVMRSDLKMRRGKEIAQSGHGFTDSCLAYWNTKEFKAWMETGCAKICVRVNSEEELLEVYQAACESGLKAKLVTDSGHTEFHNVPTKTCCVIGPDEVSQVDRITGDLTLY